MLRSMACAALLVTSLTSMAHAEEPRVRAARAPVPLDGIAAVVDDVIVFRSEVALRVRHFEAKLSRDPVKRRAERLEMEKALLARIIDEILMTKDAERLKVQVTDAEVSDGIMSVAKANNFDRKRLEAEVLKAGYSPLEYQTEIRRQIMEQRWLMLRAAGKIDPRKAGDAASFQALMEKERELYLIELRGHAFIEIR